MKDPSVARIKASLICPACAQRLNESGGTFVCAGCGKEYGNEDGIPVLVVDASVHKRAEAAYHSSVSSRYDDMHQLKSYRNQRFHLQALEPILSLQQQIATLELGCGTGFDALRLLSRNHLVVETDIAPGQVREARIRITKQGKQQRALFYVADAERIPFADGTFDAVFVVAALHHLEHPLRALQEMKRCTRGGGTILVAMEPNTSAWIRILSIPFTILKWMVFRSVGRKPFEQMLKRADGYREPAIERTFTRREITHLAHEAGLTIRRISPVWFICGFLQWLITLLNKISTRHWSMNGDVERICVHLDRAIAAIPLINSFCCHWTLHCSRE